MSAVTEPMPDLALGKGDRRRWLIHRGNWSLIGVSVAYVGAVVLLTSQSTAMSWDEVVYASQVARGVPAADFSAPRARGMSLLLAPVGAFTSSSFAIRTYLALLAGMCLYLAFRPWLSIFAERRPYMHLPAVAAGLFGTLWVTVLYGMKILPNLWLALALIAGVGYFWLFGHECGWGWRDQQAGMGVR